MTEKARWTNRDCYGTRLDGGSHHGPAVQATDLPRDSASKAQAGARASSRTGAFPGPPTPAGWAQLDRAREEALVPPNLPARKPGLHGRVRRRSLATGFGVPSTGPELPLWHSRSSTMKRHVTEARLGSPPPVPVRVSAARHIAAVLHTVTTPQVAPRNSPQHPWGRE